MPIINTGPRQIAVEKNQIGSEPGGDPPEREGPPRDAVGLLEVGAKGLR